MALWVHGLGLGQTSHMLIPREVFGLFGILLDSTMCQSIEHLLVSACALCPKTLAVTDQSGDM